jgi:hypothetical protein
MLFKKNQLGSVLLDDRFLVKKTKNLKKFGIFWKKKDKSNNRTINRFEDKING